MSAPLLTVNNLSVRFPVRSGWMRRATHHVSVVDGVSFTLDRGRTLGIVGESGCGKTTTGLAVMRLIEPSDGDICFDGDDVRAMDSAARRRLRRRLQIIFQDPYSSLNPRSSIGRSLATPLRIHGLHDGSALTERVAQILDRVGLTPDFAKRFPHELSGGQRQRVGIARALALQPDIIIADEPVSALDVSIQAQIVNLLVDLQAELGLSYIFISHDLAVVEHMCDEIIVMYLGRIVERASYRSLYAAPKHPYTQALLSAVPSGDPGRRGARIRLQGDMPSSLDPPSGCRFHSRCPVSMPRCKVESPAPVDFGQGHVVACHIYDPGQS